MELGRKENKKVYVNAFFWFLNFYNKYVKNSINHKPYEGNVKLLTTYHFQKKKILLVFTV